MTDDIKAIRDALPRMVSNAAHGPRLCFDIDAWHKATHPERIARLLDALELATKDAAAFRAIVDGLVSVSFTPSTVKVGEFGRANLNTLRKQCGVAEFVRKELAAIDAAMKGQA